MDAKDFAILFEDQNAIGFCLVLEFLEFRVHRRIPSQVRKVKGATIRIPFENGASHKWNGVTTKRSLDNILTGALSLFRFETKKFSMLLNLAD